MARITLNSIAGKYAKHVCKNDRLCGVGAGILSGAVALVMIGAVSEIEMTNRGLSRDMPSFKSARDAVVRQYADNVGTGLILVMILPYLFMELGILGARHTAKRFAEFIIKRCGRDIGIDVNDMSPERLHDVADLLLANMTDAERDAILQIGIKLNQCGVFDKNTHDIHNMQELVCAKNDIRDICHSVLARNDGLDVVIRYILAGKLMYTPKMFMTHQK